MKQEEIYIDVTSIEPRLKHPYIFEKFDSLLPGESMLIHNDHDPKPLFYQLLAERGKSFNWNYHLKGPLIWEVNIEKHQAVGEEETIGSITAKDLRKAEVFSKFGIDFCCNGNRTLEQVCAEQRIDLENVKEALKAVDLEGSDIPEDFVHWDAGRLLIHIQEKHHTYVRGNLPLLLKLSEKVLSVHGQSSPELHAIDRNIRLLSEELGAHLQKEEIVLFPYIMQLHAASINGGGKPGGHFDSVGIPVRIMEMEHESAGEIMGEIKSLSSSYTPPEHACNSFRLLYNLLEEFETDLHIHIHLENNILFPKAIQMEKNLDANYTPPEMSV